MPRPFDVDGCVVVGVDREAARRTNKLCLVLPVFFGGMAAAGALLAGVGWIYQKYQAAQPSQLVFDLAEEFAPALIQDRLVETGLLADVSPRGLQGAFGRLAHGGHLQVFLEDDSVVFADITGDFVQVVVASVGDADVQPGDFCLLFVPIS